MKFSNVCTFPLTLARVALFILTLGLAQEARFGRAAADPPPMLLEVDAREVSRKLIYARMEIPVQPGKLALWYPKWLPGNHSPAGSIENIGGLRLETMAGKSVPWRRDEADVFRIQTTVPEGSDRIVVKLDAQWHFGSPLTVTSQTGHRIEFETETLRDLVDCPLICGAT